ncbi:MAG: NAD(P)-dependent alcohol dehydrogenase [Candidatus Thorarchaeota archaeon]|nr:MAG: NAD(P)-dependent alcohol dehydrogenase [Candidatus Thorarchaeota archaeon]
MKAIVYEKYGGPEVLQIREVPKPSPKDNEVLIKVHATSVSAADRRMRAADPFLVRLMTGLHKPKKFNILGFDLSGEIEEVGADVTKFKVGDQVFGGAGFNFGAYAEYLNLSEDATLTTKPSNMTFAEAAAVPVGGDTAIYFMKHQGNVQPGQKVLIYGASGSVGTFTIQVAKHLGAEVTAVCSTTNLDLVKSLGADHTIDYTNEDFTKSGETYDVVFDAVGKLSISNSMKALKEEGIFLDAVGMLRRSVQGKFATMRSSKKVMGGSALELVEDLIYLRELIEDGKLKSVIDRIYPIDEIVEAHRYADTGRKKGNVVITVVDDN